MEGDITQEEWLRIICLEVTYGTPWKDGEEFLLNSARGRDV